MWMGMSLETAVKAERLRNADGSPDYEYRLTFFVEIQKF
jgi:hypothetical protein